MNEQLNKKLAEWAEIDVARVENPTTGQRWYYEDAIPVFTESLDACFEWLVPKAHRVLGDKEFFKLLVRWCIKIITEGNEALALCLAIEKLIK